MEILKCTKKPIIFKTIQISKNNSPLDAIEEIEKMFPNCYIEYDWHTNDYVLDNIDGIAQHCNTGDYIVQLADGDYYAYKKSNFERIYNIVQ